MYSNIFEQAYTALANIMATSDELRDICISYGFLPTFFQNCKTILLDTGVKQFTDQTLPETLCHMLSSVTSGATKCSIDIAYETIPFVLKMGKGFEGDSSLYVLKVTNFPSLLLALKFKNPSPFIG